MVQYEANDVQSKCTQLTALSTKNTHGHGFKFSHDWVKMYNAGFICFSPTIVMLDVV